MKPVCLLILDGFGYRAEREGNAIAHASMPNFKSWLEHCSWTTLQAAGQSVGLCAGMNGNSAVGHLTMGSGQILEQPIAQFERMRRDGSLFHNKMLTAQLQDLKARHKRLHFLGLLSDGNVHSNYQDLFALIDVAVQKGIHEIIVHAILDGRDVQPRSAAFYLEVLEKKIDALSASGISIKIGSVHGRFYGMDRNNNEDRTQKSYVVLAQKISVFEGGWRAYLADAYAQGLTDEYVVPVALIPDATFAPGDALIFFNIRADRARQITRMFLNNKNLSWIITGIVYADEFKLDALCTVPTPKNTLLDELGERGKTVFVAAESEKYAHVTYFFHGGVERICPHETRVIVPSGHPDSFAQVPALQAPVITREILQSLEQAPRDFYLVNFANADMLGHTGDFAATCAGLQIVDECMAQLYRRIVCDMQGILIITGDHGNCEDMREGKRSHTSNSVYFLVLAQQEISQASLENMHTLADIKRFILE